MIFRRFLLLLPSLLSMNVHKNLRKKTLQTQNLQNLSIKVIYCKFTIFLLSKKKDSVVSKLPNNEVLGVLYKIQNAHNISILNFD
jgi:hypothetical protein